MNTTQTARALSGALLLSLFPGAHAADSLTEAVARGTVSLDIRARYEHAAQTGLRDAGAFTARPRLGYTTGTWSSLQAMIEFETISALDGDAYNQAGINPGGAGRAVIADPEGSELNQAWLAYAGHNFTLKAGRQRIVHDNARFIGDVGWRQNMQTFDAASLTARPADALQVSYSHLWRINRVFGDEHAQGRWRSNSHLLNAALKATPAITVTGYIYLLDFDNSPANSSATYGIRATGSHVFDESAGSALSYKLEYARQTDFADQPVNYAADYQSIELGWSRARVNAGLGRELLGSDGGAKGFATPLATLHAFNGWADLFPATPAEGLEDFYAWIGGSLPGAIGARLVHHRFESDTGGIDLGLEWDLQLTRSFGPNWSVLIKAADFDSDGALPDVTRYWAQAEFKF